MKVMVLGQRASACTFDHLFVRLPSLGVCLLCTYLSKNCSAVHSVIVCAGGSCLLFKLLLIDHIRYIKIQPKTIDLSTRLLGINPTNSVFIPTSLVLRSIVLG